MIEAAPSLVRKFDDVEQAWRYWVEQVLRFGTRRDGVCDPKSVGSAFSGAPRPFLNLRDGMLCVTNPCKRSIRSSIRQPNSAFNAANAVWMLSGSSDLSMIQEYNPRARFFTDDGLAVPSALGPKIFGRDNLRPFETAVARLRSDGGSRRAVIPLFTERDCVADTRDVSCWISVQFDIEGSALFCHTHMRSQSAFMMLPYDVFQLTLLQEMVAFELDLAVGEYRHSWCSLHVYEDECARAEQMLDEQPNGEPVLLRMRQSAHRNRNRIVDSERAMRQRIARDHDAAIDDIVSWMDPLWAGMFRDMEAFLRVKFRREL